MRTTIRNGLRTCAFVIAAHVLTGGVIWATPSDCADDAVGQQTGQSYTKTGQSTVTETTTFTISGGGGCGVSAGATGTRSETYNVGTYRNNVTGEVVRVNCSTGRVIERLED
jgi:hypothetical protein